MIFSEQYKRTNITSSNNSSTKNNKKITKTKDRQTDGQNKQTEKRTSVSINFKKDYRIKDYITRHKVSALNRCVMLNETNKQINLWHMTTTPGRPETS